MKKINHSKIIICYVIFDVVLVGVAILVMLCCAFDLFFLFKGYNYVDYNGERYTVVDSLYFEDAIIYDQNAEFSEYVDGYKVWIKTNGWYKQKMILIDNQDNNFLFDYNHEEWLVKEKILDNDILDESKIDSIMVEFKADDTGHELSDEEKLLFIQYAKDLKNSSNVVPKDFTFPKDDVWGTIYIKVKGMPDNARYEMFYFSENNGRIFLLSTSNSFGFEYGKYIYITE